MNTTKPTGNLSSIGILPFMIKVKFLSLQTISKTREKFYPITMTFWLNMFPVQTTAEFLADFDYI